MADDRSAAPGDERPVDPPVSQQAPTTSSRFTGRVKGAAEGWQDTATAFLQYADNAPTAAATATTANSNSNGETSTGASNSNSNGAGEGASADGADAMDTATAWKEVSWDVARAAMAKEVLEKEQQMVSQDEREKIEHASAANWEVFYKRNKANFFKERHYLWYQFPQLKLIAEDENTPMERRLNGDSAPLRGKSLLAGQRWMECGCGTGASLYPLINAHMNTTWFALDLSPSAIQCVKENRDYTPERVKAYACDVLREPLPDTATDIDGVLMIFMLSAVPRAEMGVVLKKLYNVMKPGGCILFRDYGLYDMTQLRFLAKKGRKLGTNYYLRADGTTTYYYTLDELSTLFGEAGFVAESLSYDTRELRNRRRKINMYRVWVNGKFVKKSNDGSSNSSNGNNSGSTSNGGGGESASAGKAEVP